MSEPIGLVALLRDPGWGSISALLAVVAIGASFLVYRWQRPRKSLSYSYSAYPLLTVSEQLAGRLKILLDGHEVQNVEVLFVSFVNDGNAPIERSDFDVPVSISFEDWTSVLSVALDENGIAANTAFTGPHQVRLEPLLINAGDKVNLKFLIAPGASKFVVSGRIVGVSSIKQFSPKNALALVLTALIASFIASVAVLASLPSASRNAELPFGGYVALFISLAGSVAGVFGIFRSDFRKQLAAWASKRRFARKR